MAKRELRANDVFIFISYNGGTSYSTVICLTSNGTSRSRDVVTSATKCGTTSTVGSLTETVNFEGVIMVDPDAGESSFVDLLDLMTSGDSFTFKQGVLEPGDGDYTAFGVGYLSALDDTYAVDSNSTFSGTITPTSPLTYTRATS